MGAGGEEVQVGVFGGGWTRECWWAGSRGLD